MGESVTLNPHFEGSTDVGGADGDLILNRCLIDFKTTVNPKLDPEWLRQLVGYVLLDYSNAHEIDSIAIYLARQKILLQWPIEELLHALSGEIINLSTMRTEFKEVTQFM